MSHHHLAASRSAIKRGKFDLIFSFSKRGVPLCNVRRSAIIMNHNHHVVKPYHPDLPSMTSFNLHFQLPVSKKILAQSCRGHSVERCNKHANDEHRGAEADTLAMAVIEVELK
jgi:hypothetical protein